MINELQSSKDKTNVNFQFEEDPFSKNAEGISKNYHEVLIIMNFLQTKLQIKNMNKNYHALLYTLNKNRIIKKM